MRSKFCGFAGEYSYTDIERLFWLKEIFDPDLANDASSYLPKNHSCNSLLESFELDNEDAGFLKYFENEVYSLCRHQNGEDTQMI